MTVWDCKIGTLEDLVLPDGCDLPMRQAIKRAYMEITGKDCEFLFSGWGGKLSDVEEDCVREWGIVSDA